MNLIEFTIDKLQYSAPKPFSTPHDKTPKHIPSIPSYRYGFIDTGTGIRYYGGNANTDKQLIILDPVALNSVGDIQDYIEGVLTMGGKFSRIDIAMTEYIGDTATYKPEDYIIDYWKGNIVSSHAKYTPKFISSVGTNKRQVETLYFGDMSSRGKKGIVRAYDKGIEQDYVAKYNLNTGDIVRLEVEDKRDKAHTTVKRYMDGSTLQQLLNSRFSVNNKRWQDRINCIPADLSRGINADQDQALALYNRLQWLETIKNAVASIRHDEILINGSSEQWDNWLYTMMSLAHPDE